MELRVEHLCKRYGENTVLDDISFTASIGVTRLLGPSGIGKTTLLRVLLGLETPDSGTVNGDKFRWTAVFQENRLLEGLDAEGNLRFVLGANYNAAAAQAHLEELGLGDVGKKKVRDYSGGMQRRLARRKPSAAETGRTADGRDDARRPPCLQGPRHERPRGASGEASGRGNCYHREGCRQDDQPGENPRPGPQQPVLFTDKYFIHRGFGNGFSAKIRRRC